MAQHSNANNLQPYCDCMHDLRKLSHLKHKHEANDYINLISLQTGRAVLEQVVGARLATSGYCIARLVYRQALDNVSDSHGLSDGTLQTKVHGRESVEHRTVIEADYWQ